MADSQPGYGTVAVSLHWLVFALILANWTLGVYMVDLPLSPRKLQTFSWHKWVGVTIFLVVVFRLAWRATHPAPSLPASIPQWQRNASAWSHFFLYLLILLIPLSGWLYSSASGVPTVYLGWLQLPDLVDKDKQLAALLKIAHLSFNSGLFILVCLHMAAALKHHFLDHDDVLARMLPFLRRSGKP
jgi:cytochrome b561